MLEVDSVEAAVPDPFDEAATRLAAGDIVGAVEILYEGTVFDRLLRAIVWRWGALDEEDCADAVAEAMASLYTKVRGGGRVRSVSAYLYKAADRAAANTYARSVRRQRAHEEAEYVERSDLDTTEMRTAAIKAARALVPELGRQNLQAVMNLILDAVEAGDPDLSTQEIAEILDQDPASVRQWRRRGFKRLEEKARERGLMRELSEIADAAAVAAQEDAEVEDDE